MQLEDYFTFISPDDIRIKGHRIGIDNVLDYYLQGYTPEQILEHFPTLNLEKIYATLTYYYHNQQEIDAYLTTIKQWKESHYQEALLNPSPMRKKITKIIKERKSVKS
ncbi:MAG: DUF433 domain-containing protein [Microcystaceae cyanobacterium]